MSVTKDSLLAYQPDLKPVTINGLGTVYVRSMTGEDKANITRYYRNHPDEEVELLARGVVAGVCDENGELLFDGGDLDKVRKMPFGVLEKLAEAVSSQSGMGDEEVAEIEGKSEATEN